jgi:hypothetical protein
MSVNLFQHVKEAIANLNPEEVRQHAARPIRVVLHASSETAYARMEQFFAPASLSPGKRSELAGRVIRASQTGGARQPHDIDIYFDEPGAHVRRGDGFTFRSDRPEAIIQDILRKRTDLAIPLARFLPAFRTPVAERIIKKIAKENALFSLATAIPDILPFVSLPWAIPEFASDSAVLTANQIRMAFFLAAASDRTIGYREQRGEIGSIVLGAFGWRALARELVGKIPYGGGLLPKAAIAYAGTRVVGMSLERYYRLGYAYTREERRAAYGDAFERGKAVAASLLQSFKERSFKQRRSISV